MADEDDLVTDDEESADDTETDTESDEGDGDEESDDSSKEVSSDTDESSDAKPTAKRGRPAKEPPPPKLWRLEGTSPEGMRVTLGRYVNKEEADPDLERLEEDGFYEKLKITKAKEE
jgi:hypothetical protein